MTIPNSATGANPGQLTPERFSQFLNANPVFAAEFEKFQRTQSDQNPQTPDKDGAEKNDERKKQVIRENRVAQNPKGEWRKFLEVVPQDAERIQEQSVYFGSIYESRKKQYWLTSGEDDWIPANENAVKNYLSVERNVPVAEMKGAVNFVTRYANVEYATQLAGYPKGIYAFDDGVRVLVNGQPKIISPVKGGWDTIRRLLTGMFGEEQLRYFYGWLQIAYYSLTTGKFIPGQGVVLAGPQDCGKTFVQENIITPFIGGRYAKPYQYMVNLTQFNSDLFMGEHLIISDEMPATEYKERLAFGESIKNLLFNPKQRLHDKGKTAIVLSPFWRLSLSVNDDPESLMILPPLKASVRDKLMLFRVCRPDCLPGDAIAAREAFGAAIRRELPAFVHHVVNEHKILAELVKGRCGIKEYCNPEIEILVGELSVEAAVYDLIEREILNKALNEEFEGTAGDFADRLKGSGSNVRSDADKLFRNSIILGKIMSSLENDRGEYKGSVTSRKSNRGRLFKVSKNFRSYDRE